MYFGISVYDSTHPTLLIQLFQFFICFFQHGFVDIPYNDLCSLQSESHLYRYLFYHIICKHSSNPACCSCDEYFLSLKINDLSLQQLAKNINQNNGNSKIDIIWHYETIIMTVQDDSSKWTITSFFSANQITFPKRLSFFILFLSSFGSLELYGLLISIYVREVCTEKNLICLFLMSNCFFVCWVLPFESTQRATSSHHLLVLVTFLLWLPKIIRIVFE